MDDEMITDQKVLDAQHDEDSEPEEDKASGPKQLRDALKRSQDEVTRLRAIAMSSAYADVGLDAETGLGKAIAKEYKGDPTTEALAEYAKDEYGYIKPVGQNHPQGEIIVNEQARLDAVSAAATSIAPPSEGEALAKAEAEGDWETTGRIKAERMARMFP